DAEGGLVGAPPEEVLDLLAVAVGPDAPLALPLEPEDEPPDDEEVEHHPVRLGREVLQEAPEVAEEERERERDDDGRGDEEHVEGEADGPLGRHVLQPHAPAPRRGLGGAGWLGGGRHAGRARGEGARLNAGPRRSAPHRLALQRSAPGAVSGRGGRGGRRGPRPSPRAAPPPPARGGGPAWGRPRRGGPSRGW